MFSASPPIAAGSEPCRHVRSAPGAVIRLRAPNSCFRPKAEATKKTGDKGIDGRMYFETKEGFKCMVLSVKGGGIRPTDLRDLRGVLAREQDMAMAGFLSLKPPSKAMWEEAATAGQFEYVGVKYYRMQLLTVSDILEGKREFHTPTKMVSRISTAQGSLAL